MQSYGNNGCDIGGPRDIAKIIGVETVGGGPWAQKELELENRTSDDQDEGENVHEKQGCTSFIGFGEHCKKKHEETACTKLNCEYYSILNVLALNLVNIAKANVNGGAICD